MRILLGTSTLVKRYAPELGRERVFALSEAAGELCAAAHRRIEVASMLGRRACEGPLDGRNAGRACARVQEDLGEMTGVPLATAVEAHAIAVLLDPPWRNGAAPHIANARETLADLSVTADHRQAVAARCCGLTTELITADGTLAAATAPRPDGSSPLCGPRGSGPASRQFHAD